MENRFLIKYTMPVQCSPNDWEIVSRERLFHPSTTLAEVKEWVRQMERGKDGFRLFEIKLSEPEQ
jgi:hypothetical protein